jgi:hypothetical protein
MTQRKKQHPLLARARAYYRLAWRRGVSAQQAETYQRIADQLVREARRQRERQAHMK